MAERDEDYVEELEETEQERGLKVNYCNKAHAYTGGNTSSMMQHFRGSHHDLPTIVADFPSTPAKSAAKLKQDIAQASILQQIENLNP